MIPDEPRQRFTGIFLPVELLELEDLCLREKMLLAIIDSLYSREHGGCYASDEYLANKLKIKMGSLKNMLIKLRKLGYISTVKNTGRGVVRKAHIGKIIEQGQMTSDVISKLPQRSQFNDLSGNNFVTQDNNAHYIHNNKEDRKEVYIRKESPPIDTKIERLHNVFTSQEEHSDLCETFGEEVTLQAYEELSLWKEDAPKRKHPKSDARAIKKWAWEPATKKVKMKQRDKKARVDADKIDSHDLERSEAIKKKRIDV